MNNVLKSITNLRLKGKYLLWAEWFVETMSGSQENSLNNIDGLINRLNPEHVDKAEYIVSSKLPVSVTIISQSYNN